MAFGKGSFFIKILVHLSVYNFAVHTQEKRTLRLILMLSK